MSDQRCEQYHELVSSFVDESLDGAELARLETHLEACAGCRDFESRLRRFCELLPAAEALRPLRRPPPGFAAAVAARAAGLPRGALLRMPVPGPRRTGAAWIGLAAAAAAALVFAWSWQRLIPGESAETKFGARPALVMRAAADEGSMELWMRQHALDSRGGTLLGPAEEVEFASFSAGRLSER